MNSPVLSVVIPVKNMKGLIAKTLEALQYQEPPVDMDILVIDDGSTDGTADYVRQLNFQNVTVIPQPHQGPATARNRGIQTAQADIVAFLDADVVPRPNWAHVLLGIFEANPTLAGVEGCTLCPNIDKADAYSHIMWNTSGGKYPTCNIAYRKAWLLRVNGFNERYRLPWREDSDLAFSVLTAGGEIRFAPEAVVEHPVLPGSVWRVCVTYALRRQYDVLLYRRFPKLYREHIEPLTDMTELAFVITFGVAMVCFFAGYMTLGWMSVLLHQIVYGQVLQRKLSRKPNVYGQEYLKAYLRFWPSTFLVMFALITGGLIFHKRAYAQSILRNHNVN